ncbi:MAG: hypothetical protein CO119_08335 [Flavobacteriales bacterium CG_4_9_14_3_um_filter_40_17]|nr:MAG: hypothetical protein CO119_08335 [Flavobacteriales bacterium CG_4_9_14_3_um_filter_40_17]
MELILYIFAVIFGFLLIGLFYTLLKDFREIVHSLINRCKPDFFCPITWFLSPIWLIGFVLDNLFGFDILVKNRKNNQLEKYPSTKNLEMDFEFGDKLIFSNTSKRNIESLIKEFLDFCDGNLRFDNFNIKNTKPITVLCPNQITFYDFNILIQHVCNKVKESWGIFNSRNLSYYSYSDENTIHNIVGQTITGQKFSIYTLDDLYNEKYLKLNQDLSVKKFDWSFVQHRN